MKKIIITSLVALALALGSTQAAYTIKIPMEQFKGGALPNGSIKFTNDTRDAEGVKGPWEVFADARSLSKDWNNLSWSSKNLTEIPATPYLLTSVNNIYLFNNQLTNIEGLRNLTSVSGELSLSSNQLTNVDALINLTSVSGLYLQNNKLTNIDGLRNIQASGNISIDKTYSGPKLAASTRFCSLNDTSRFIIPNAQKPQLCNP